MSALDKLERYANDKEYLERDRAKEYWKTIVDSNSEPKHDTTGTSWFTNGKTKSIADLSAIFDRSTTDIPDAMKKSGTTEGFKTRVDITRKDKLSLLANMLSKEQNIIVLAQVGRAFNEVAGSGFHPLARAEMLKWWKENADKMK